MKLKHYLIIFILVMTHVSAQTFEEPLTAVIDQETVRTAAYYGYDSTYYIASIGRYGQMTQSQSSFEGVVIENYTDPIHQRAISNVNLLSNFSRVENKFYRLVDVNPVIDPDNFEIRLNKITAVLRQPYEGYKQQVRILIWERFSTADTLFTEEKVLWEASFTLDGQYLLHNQNFIPNEFTLSHYSDSVVLNLLANKTVNLPVGTPMNYLVLELTSRTWEVHEEVAPANTASSQPIQFELYPNPTSEVLNIRLMEYLEIDTEVHITDLTGKLINTTMIRAGTQQQAINIDDLNKGIYLITVRKGNIVNKKLMMKS